MEKKKEKFESTVTLQRIAALIHNPYFQQEVEKLRDKYEISKKIINTDKEIDEIMTMEITNDTLDTWFSNDLADTKSKIKRDVWVMLLQFQLPPALFRRVYGYVITLHNYWIDFSIKSAILSVRTVGEMPIQLTLQLDPWTNKRQWNDMWERTISKIVKEYRKDVIGIGELSTKRSTIKSYLEQMRRWGEWYQYSEVEGLGPIKALQKWEDNHPEQIGKYDFSTVTHATQEFERIISPIPISEVEFT